MSESERDINDRKMPYRRGLSYTERHERYAANALAEADKSEHRARQERRSIKMIESAAANARRQGDPGAADLYDDLAEICKDIAEAQEGKAGQHRRIAAYYAARHQR